MIARSAFPMAVILLISSARADDPPAKPDSPLVKLLKRGNLPEDRLATIAEMVARRGTAADRGYVVGRCAGADALPATVRHRVLNAVAEVARTSQAEVDGAEGKVAALLASTEAADRRDGAEVAGALKLKSLASTLKAMVAEGPVGEKATAADALAAIVDRQALSALSEPSRPLDVRMPSVAALARLDADAASKLAAALLKDAPPTADVAPLVSAFLTLKEGPAKLGAAIEAAGLPADPAKLALRAVYALGHAEDALVDPLKKAAGLDAEVKPTTPAEMDRLVADVAAKGNPERGERVFRRAELNCMGCHALAGAAGGVGPELSAVGQVSPVDYLVNSIMLPDQAIKEQYHTLVVATADGQVFQGIVVDKDDAKITLKDATGATRVVPVSAVEEQKEGGSLMPKGLVNFLTRAEFVDLVRFLSELGKPGAYAIHSTPTIQRWRLAKSGETEAATWRPAYALSTGLVPLAEFAAVGDPELRLKGEIEVTAAGPLAIRVGDATGLKAILDGSPLDLGAEATPALAVGRHTLELAVDTRARGGRPLKVEVARPAGGSAEYAVVGGR